MELPEDEDLFFACYRCKAPQSLTQSLRHCSGCQLVAYCSIECQKSDRSTHKYVCKEFPIVDGNNALYTTGSWEEHIDGLRKRAARLPYADDAAKPIFRYPRVCNTCRNPCPYKLTYCKCAGVCYCSTECANVDKLHINDCSNLKSIWDKFCQGNMRLAYPLSLWHALNSLMEPEVNYLNSLTTLNVHVVISSSYLDAVIWETLFHTFPNLKELNLIFFIQGKNLNPSFNHTKMLIQPKCDECKAKNSIITSTVYQEPYHVIYSSLECTEPDVVAIYGIPSEESNFNKKISYHNMTNSYDTVIVLMESTVERVLQGWKDVNEARSVHLIVPDPSGPTINIQRGFGSHRAELEFDADAINEKKYFLCMRKKLW